MDIKPSGRTKDIKPFDGVDRNQILSMMRKRKLPQLAWPSKDVDAWPWIFFVGLRCRPFLHHWFQPFFWELVELETALCQHVSLQRSCK